MARVACLGLEVCVYLSDSRPLPTSRFVQVAIVQRTPDVCALDGSAQRGWNLDADVPRVPKAL